MSQHGENLVSRVKAHNVAALADYLIEMRTPLSAFIERQWGTALRRKVEVDDIFQEASLEAVRAHNAVDFEGPRAVFLVVSNCRAVDRGCPSPLFRRGKAGRRS